jgi:hypothetical protein
MISASKFLVFFGLCLTLGYSFFWARSEEALSAREPASVDGKTYRLSTLTPEQIKARLQKQIHVGRTVNGKKTISFSGFSASLCKTYSVIEIEFAAEGVSVDGQAPSMKITTPCEAAPNSTEMALINIPVGQLLSEKPRNADFSYAGFTAQLTFDHTAEEWPRQWVLKNVLFKHHSGGENQSAAFSRAPASHDTPIVLEF